MIWNRGIVLDLFPVIVHVVSVIFGQIILCFTVKLKSTFTCHLKNPNNKKDIIFESLLILADEKLTTTQETLYSFVHSFDDCSIIMYINVKPPLLLVCKAKILSLKTVSLFWKHKWWFQYILIKSRWQPARKLWCSKSYCCDDPA